LAYDGKLLAAVTRIAIDSILGFYKRRIRDVDGVVGFQPRWSGSRQLQKPPLLKRLPPARIAFA